MKNCVGWEQLLITGCTITCHPLQREGKQPQGYRKVQEDEFLWGDAGFKPAEAAASLWGLIPEHAPLTVTSSD